MQRFIIEEDFLEVFPNAKLGIIVVKGINNNSEIDFESKIKAAGDIMLEKIGDMELAKHPSISVWRDAYKKFNSPKQNRSSIEALIRRIYNGKGLGTINPLVDIYNIVSIKYMLPCGGEDLDIVKGDIRLIRAEGNEPFIPLGSSENDPPLKGEVIYKDDGGAICRCWNWREADRTKLTEETKNAFLCIECIDENKFDEFKAAVEELALMVREYLGGEQKIYFVDSSNPVIEI
jgi:DNA/RNA-binding domain of Phe-tRNA-synthetase-like protein